MADGSGIFSRQNTMASCSPCTPCSPVDEITLVIEGDIVTGLPVVVGASQGGETHECDDISNDSNMANCDETDGLINGRKKSLSRAFSLISNGYN